MPLTIQSGCKINLLLNILGKRDDGFHELETIMHPVPVFDTLTFERTGNSISLGTTHPTLPCDESNLIVKAARRFCSVAQISDGVKIHLEKNLPMEAGLGGGSSNAACTLTGLNTVFGSPLTNETLHGIAAELGSDVPFFLQQGPALATGRGERIQPLGAFNALSGHHLVLVHPGFGISTAWSYKTLTEFPEALNGRPGRAQELVTALAETHSKWGQLLYNSLESPAFMKFPVLELYVEEFLKNGAAGALMSGSGSTVFAIFNTGTGAEAALEVFKSKFGTAGWSAIVPLHPAG